MCMCAYVHFYVCIRACMRAYACACVRMCTFTCAFMRACVHMHGSVHAHVCVCALLRMLLMGDFNSETSEGVIVRLL